MNKMNKKQQKVSKTKQKRNIYLLFSLLVYPELSFY